MFPFFDRYVCVYVCDCILKSASLMHLEFILVFGIWWEVS